MEKHLLTLLAIQTVENVKQFLSTVFKIKLKNLKDSPYSSLSVNDALRNVSCCNASHMSAPPLIVKGTYTRYGNDDENIIVLIRLRAHTQ